MSMTGYGDAVAQTEVLVVRIELRSVNNRHLKVNYRLPDGYAPFESRLESVLRDRVRRGTVHLALHVEHIAGIDEYRLNEHVLLRYHQQLTQLARQIGEATVPSLGHLLSLPGIVHETSRTTDELELEWPLIETTLESAVESLNRMRQVEGAAMAADLTRNCGAIHEALQAIRLLTPAVIEAYQTRLMDRLQQLLAPLEVSVEPASLVREVGIYADRVDVAEEIVRLDSHLQQFQRIMQDEEAPGRKLDFMVQELLRETNTIGSKANDAQIAMHVVQIKTHLERLREMVQNVE